MSSKRVIDDQLKATIVDACQKLFDQTIGRPSASTQCVIDLDGEVEMTIRYHRDLGFGVQLRSYAFGGVRRFRIYPERRHGVDTRPLGQRPEYVQRVVEALVVWDGDDWSCS